MAGASHRAGRYGRILAGFLLLLLGLTVDRQFDSLWSWMGGGAGVSWLLLVVWALLLASGVLLVATGIARVSTAALVRGEGAEAARRLREKIDGARASVGEKLPGFEAQGLDPAVAALMEKTFQQFNHQQLINAKILEICEDLLEREMAASADRAAIHERLGDGGGPKG